MEEVLSNALPYRHCPYCQTEVTVERRFPRAVLFLLAMTAVSLLITALLFPRFIFLFVFLPFGFGLWRRAEYCAGCGRRVPSVKSQR
jgi:hypothetical protein